MLTAFARKYGQRVLQPNACTRWPKALTGTAVTATLHYLQTEVRAMSNASGSIKKRKLDLDPAPGLLPSAQNLKGHTTSRGQPGETELGALASVIYQPQAFSRADSQKLFANLQEEVAFEQRTITVMGRRVLQPRLVAYMADESDARMTYSGTTMQPAAWTPSVLRIKAQVEAVAGTTFDSCLLNFYRDGRDYVSWHSDNETLYGTHNAIGSASFGATREFILRRNANHHDKICFTLASGDILIMRGSTQQQWMHTIPKRTNLLQPRINLTFRKIVVKEKPRKQ